MRSILKAIALVCALPAGAAGQEGAVAGVVRDTAGAPVAAVTVSARRAPAEVGGAALALRRTETDSLGRYRLAGLEPGQWMVGTARMGYAPKQRLIVVAQGEATRLDFALALAAVEVAPLRVQASRERERFATEAGVTSLRISHDELKRVPGLAEADVIRAVQVLPGVVITSDYSAAYHVRGGSADENLIQLDGFPVYNPFHLGGLFGVFNSDMVSDAELLAGGFPAQYGGRVSSVLNVESDPGRAGGGLQGAGGVSLLASRLALSEDLPAGAARTLGLKSGRTAISFRRSYFDALLKPVTDFPYHLTDVQGYFEGWTPGGGRLTLTGYTGGDVLDLSGQNASFPLRLRMDWGNDMLGAHWTGGWGPGRTLDLRAGYTRFAAAIRFPDYSDTRFESRIGQGLVRADAHVDASPALALEWGVGGDRLSYTTLARAAGSDFRNDGGAGWQASGYAQVKWHAGGWLTEAGLRGDGWYPGSTRATWLGSPRLAVKRFLARGDVALNLSVGRFTQVVQSIRNEDLPIGIDIWQLAGERQPPVVSDQVQAGIESFRPKGWHVALTGYHRRFRGVVADNPAADPNDPRQELLVGSGRSQGADLLVKKEQGAVNGWLAASWLRATRTFPDVLSGEVPAPEITYPPIFDRRLDLELVLRYPLPRKIEGGLRASFGTGLPYTRPLGAYGITDVSMLTGLRHLPPQRDSTETSIVLGPRNGARYPAYLRIDVSLRKTMRKHWGLLSPYLDVLNVTNRRNVLFYFYQYNKSPPVRSGVSMFPFLPTVGVEATF